MRHISHAIAGGTPPPIAATDGYSLSFRVAAIVLFLGALASAVFMKDVRSTPVTPGMEEAAIAETTPSSSIGAVPSAEPV